MALPSLTSLLLGKQYIGVEHFSLNTEEKMAYLLVEKKKGELVTSQKDHTNYNGVLPESWDKNLPVYLVINTSQVIQKEINETDASDEKLLHKAFPNLAWSEFYYEIWRLKRKSIIAISRKNYVDDLLSNYNKQEFSVAGMSLGICAIAEIINYSDKNEFSTNHQIITWSENAPILSTKTDDLTVTYNINDLNIQSSHLLAFTGILRLVIGGSSTSGNLIDHNYELYDTYNQKSFFSKGFKIMVGVVLIILLVNFFTFNHFYAKAQNTSANLMLSKSSLEAVTRTKERIKTKEQKVKNVVVSTSSQSSLVINEITTRIPQSILLTELIYYPLEKKIKTEEPIVTQEKTITLAGTTINNEAFTHWIEEIERLKGINQVIIAHFGKNELNETEFSIKLTLKENENK